jgi:G6PDH family F420-dependent oxidoreductase
MPRLGYALSSEEHGPDDLVEYASRAEAVGFDFAMLSDHFHPWISKQGHSPFVWSTLGGIARETDTLQVGTGVTCPTIRTHPAIIAQAAATTADMFDGRFELGVGTGENLNEHVHGDRWPEHDVRLEMLVEAVAVIRELWTGENVSHHGEHYTVENAKLFTLPEESPSINVAAGGPETAEVAGRIGDGLVGTSPESEVVDRFRSAGEAGDGPTYGQLTICYAETEAEAKEIAHEWWPNSGLPGELGQELPTPKHFEQAVQTLDEDEATENVVCGSDPQAHVEGLQQFVDAGFDHVYVHQVGPNQSEFFEFYEEEVIPQFS